MYNFPDEQQILIMLDNECKFQMDGDENIYCAFMYYPIIRKYDKNLKLLWEVKYDTVTIIKDMVKKISKDHEKNNKRKIGVYITGTRGYGASGGYFTMTVDSKTYFYIMFSMSLNEDHLYWYVFSSIDGKFLYKKIHFEDIPSGISVYQGFDFSHPDFIYAYFHRDMTVLKFKK
jgi:hypothetical protein